MPHEQHVRLSGARAQKLLRPEMLLQLPDQLMFGLLVLNTEAEEQKDCAHPLKFPHLPHTGIDCSSDIRPDNVEKDFSCLHSASDKALLHLSRSCLPQICHPLT